MFGIHIFSANPFSQFEKLKYGGERWLSQATMGVMVESTRLGTYPLVNIQKAIENDHRNSGFSH
jgi:hypothetical protein